MPLLDFQQALGQMVLASASGLHQSLPMSLFEGADLSSEESQQLRKMVSTPGFRLTSNIQRSWCRGRAAKSAILTLSILQVNLRDNILDEWILTGNSTGLFFTSDAVNFLEFIGQRLPDPSHALSICRFEQAVFRASLGELTFDRQSPCASENSEVKWFNNRQYL
jgi:hypothetical protein